MTKSSLPRRANHALVDLQIIHAKCTEEGDCWLWHGAMHGGAPVLRAGRQMMSVRRYIAIEIQKRVVGTLLASTECGNAQCCAPDHIAMLTRKQLNQRVTQRTRHQSQLHRNHKLSMSKRGQSPLTADQVAEIRMSTLQGRPLARKYGVALDTVQNIRNGRTWRDYASPFAGLMP